MCGRQGRTGGANVITSSPQNKSSFWSSFTLAYVLMNWITGITVEVTASIGQVSGGTAGHGQGKAEVGDGGSECLGDRGFGAAHGRRADVPRRWEGGRAHVDGLSASPPWSLTYLILPLLSSHFGDGGHATDT